MGLGRALSVPGLSVSVLTGIVTVVRVATHLEKVATSLSSSLFFHSPQKRTEVGGAGYIWARRVRRPAGERSVMPMCPGQLGGRAKTLAVTIDKSEKGGKIQGRNKWK